MAAVFKKEEEKGKSGAIKRAADGTPRHIGPYRTYVFPYLLHIPSWMLTWHLTLAALQASHALVMRGARGAGPGAGHKAGTGAAAGRASIFLSCLVL